MIDETLQEKAIDYVLGQMSGPEAASFEAAMKNDATLRGFVSDMNTATAAVALSAQAVAPPRDLLVRVLNELRPRPAPYEIPVTFPWIPWALAACLAIACTLMAAYQTKLENQVAALEQRNVLSQVKIATLNSQVAAYAQAMAVVVWNAQDQRGVVEFARLPALDPSHDYQLWVIDPAKPAPVSAGVVRMNPDGSAKVNFQPVVNVRNVAQFAVSIERKGGGAAPQGQIVLAGK
jgi:anti-sigma-K factor RskA